jgi:hypothetical protein
VPTHDVKGQVYATPVTGNIQGGGVQGGCIGGPSLGGYEPQGKDDTLIPPTCTYTVIERRKMHDKTQCCGTSIIVQPPSGATRKHPSTPAPLHLGRVSAIMMHPYLPLPLHFALLHAIFTVQSLSASTTLVREARC